MADGIWPNAGDPVKEARQALAMLEFVQRFGRVPQPDDMAGVLQFALAEALQQRYTQLHAQKDLNEAIESHYKALQLLPSQHDMRYQVLYHLACALSFRFEWTKDEEDVNQSIIFARGAIKLWPSDDSKQDASLLVLAAGLQCYYALKKRDQDLTEAIGVHRQAFQISKPDHEGEVLYSQCLDFIFLSGYMVKCNKEELDQVISLYKEGHQFWSDDPKQNMIALKLTWALQSRYKSSNDEHDLDQIIDFYEYALSFVPLPYETIFLSRCAEAFQTRYNRKGTDQDLVQTIHYHRKALQSDHSDHSSQSTISYHLACALYQSYVSKGNEQDLNEAIDVHRRALEFRLVKNSERASSLTDLLAGALQTRYEIKSDDKDLHEAIDFLKEALQIWPHDHHNRGISYDNLAKALHARYVHKGNTHDLLQAIEFHQTALELQPTGHSGRIVSLSNFASTLYSYYKVIEDEKILEKAMACQQEALRSHPSNDPFRTGLLANMAVYIESCTNPDEQGLNKAIDFYTHILHAHHITRIDRSIYSNGLANALKSRHKLKGNKEDLDQAIVVLRDAIQLLPFGHPARGGCLNNLANFLCLQYQQTQELKHARESIDIFEQSSADPDCGALQKVHLAYDWAMFASQINHESALKAYTNVFTALETFLLIAPTLTDQYMALAEYANLGVYAASHAFNLNQHQFALKFLEQGRALLWSQVRHFKVHSDLVEKHPLIQQYLQVAKSLETLATSKQSYHSENTFDDYLGAMYKQKEDLDQTRKTLIGQIQQSPGYEDFMKLPSYAILQSVATEGPVVVINCSHNRSDILIMHHATLTHLPLDHDFYEKAKNISDQLLSQRHHITTKPKFYSALLGDIMREVWEILVSHIVDKLMELGVQKQSRVWWCPTSFVANIPLHAAGPIPGKKKYFCDLYVSSYIPTLTALFNARMNQNHQEEGPISMLAISQLTESLPSVTAELEAIQSQVNINISILENDSATASAALQEMENCSWIHFSCHGELAPDVVRPFDAAFVLAGDSRLTLLDIVKAHLPHAQFAIVEARLNTNRRDS